MKVVRLAGPVAACMLALNACGGGTSPSNAPRSTDPAEPTVAAAQCGTVPVAAGSVNAYIRTGSVGCDEARSLVTQYFAQLSPDALANPEGAGPVTVGGWTCGSDPGAPLSATCSTEDGRQVTTTPA